MTLELLSPFSSPVDTEAIATRLAAFANVPAEEVVGFCHVARSITGIVTCRVRLQCRIVSDVQALMPWDPLYEILAVALCRACQAPPTN